MKECQARGNIQRLCLRMEGCYLKEAWYLEKDTGTERDFTAFLVLAKRQTGCQRHEEIINEIESQIAQADKG